MIIEGVVNPPSNSSYSDGDDVVVRCGKTGEWVISPQHAEYYQQTYWRKMFHGSSTTSVTIPITSTTAPTFILWNHYGSGVNCVLVKYLVGYVSGKTVEGNIQLGVILNAGDKISTGAPISTFTDSAVMNGILEVGMPEARFGVAATIIAATHFLPLGLSPMQLDATSSAPAMMEHKFDGTVIIPPGVAVFSCASADSVAKFHERIVWYEYPT